MWEMMETDTETQQSDTEDSVEKEQQSPVEIEGIYNVKINVLH